MVNEHYFRINSTEDIHKALTEAEREGYDLTFYNSVFLILGEEGLPISVDDSLENLHVVACGPSPVWVSGGSEKTVRAEGDVVIYATEDCRVDAYDSATVYAYDRAQVDVRMDAAVHVASDDVDVEAWGDSRIYLPAEGLAGANPYLRLEDSSKVIRGVADPSRTEN